jgi:DNA-dependent RNA polymerase auxiliary subunit epsilon
MDIERAYDIMRKMIKDRYLAYNQTNIEKILDEFVKYEKNGECSHLWPDENTACAILVNQRNA